MAPLWARHLAPLWARHWPPCGLDIWPPCGPNVSTGTTLTRVPLWLRRRTCPAHHFSAAWPPRTAAGATTAHGCAVCLSAAAPTAKASASSLLAPSLRTLRSHTCPCDCAGELSTCISLLQCGRRAQRLAPTLLTVTLCASQSRPPRRGPVHLHRSRRLHAHNAHARASVIALTNFPRTSLLCHVAATHSGWRHHRSRPRCVPRNRDPHGESQCIPTAHAVSTRPTLMRVPL